MSEVNVVYQMYNTLSKQDKMRFMQMLGMPTKMTEIIDSTTMEEFLDKYRFHDGVFCPHCGLIDCIWRWNTWISDGEIKYVLSTDFGSS